GLAGLGADSRELSLVGARDPGDAVPVGEVVHREAVEPREVDGRPLEPERAGSDRLRLLEHLLLIPALSTRGPVPVAAVRPDADAAFGHEHPRGSNRERAAHEVGAGAPAREAG